MKIECREKAASNREYLLGEWLFDIYKILMNISWKTENALELKIN